MAKRRPLTRLLQDYEKYLSLNSDLPKTTLRQLAVFYLAPKATKESLNKIFNHEFNSTPYYHRSWYWWNCFRLSGLDDEWERFVKDRNQGKEVHQCLKELKSRTDGPSWNLLLRRLGYGPQDTFDPSAYSSSKKDGSSPTTVWTKGGTWPLSSNWTRIIVLKKHLPRRTLTQPYQFKLGHAGVRKLESELMHLIDPNQLLVPEAKKRAVQYVRKRMPEMLGYKRKASYIACAWFFDCPVQGPDGFWYRVSNSRPFKRTREDWRWW